MSHQESSGFCNHCQRQVLARRADVNHILHAVLTIVLCGLWLVPWALVSVRVGGWRCADCGSGVKGNDSALSGIAMALIGGVALYIILVVVVAGYFATFTPPASSTGTTPAGARRNDSSASPSAAPDELEPYRSNIGKTAFNLSNGVEQGRIEGVGYAKIPGEGWVAVYKVRYRGKYRDSPVDNVEARDVPATVAEP